MTHTSWNCPAPIQEGWHRCILTLHGFEMTPETDARGYFKLIKHHQGSFRFLLDESEAFQPRPEGNILLDPEFSSEAEFEKSGCFTVRLDSVIEDFLSAEFRARAGEVVSVVPCDSRGALG